MRKDLTLEPTQLLDEHLELTLPELCRTCALDVEQVMDMVAEGILEPRGRSPREWRFTGPQVWRVRVAVHLQYDLQLNLAGAALAVDLLEEIETLRERLRLLEALAGRRD